MQRRVRVPLVLVTKGARLRERMRRNPATVAWLQMGPVAAALVALFIH